MTIEWANLSSLEPTFNAPSGQSDPVLLYIPVVGNSLTAFRNPYIYEPNKYQQTYLEYYDNSNNAWASVDDKTKFFWTYLNEPEQPEVEDATP